MMSKRVVSIPLFYDCPFGWKKTSETPRKTLDNQFRDHNQLDPDVTRSFSHNLPARCRCCSGSALCAKEVWIVKLHRWVPRSIGERKHMKTPFQVDDTVGVWNCLCFCASRDSEFSSRSVHSWLNHLSGVWPGLQRRQRRRRLATIPKNMTSIEAVKTFLDGGFVNI